MIAKELDRAAEDGNVSILETGAAAGQTFLDGVPVVPEHQAVGAASRRAVGGRTVTSGELGHEFAAVESAET